MDRESWSEKRRYRRRSISACAVIASGKGEPLAPCIVKDVSVGGARLETEAPDLMPDHFVLWLSATGRTRRGCEVRWRSGRQLGVRFTFTTCESD